MLARDLASPVPRVALDSDATDAARLIRNSDCPVSSSRAATAFWRFTKCGALVTAVLIPISALYVWLRYFVLA